MKLCFAAVLCLASASRADVVTGISSVGTIYMPCGSTSWGPGIGAVAGIRTCQVIEVGVGTYTYASVTYDLGHLQGRTMQLNCSGWEMRPAGVNGNIDTSSTTSFTLPTPSRFRLAGTLAGGSASATLAGAATIFHGTGGLGAFSTVGNLGAGTYTYTLTAGISNGSWTADVALTILCLADFDDSGTVTVQDIFDFLAAWFAGDARADFNHSGAITVGDIFDFLEGWFAGCP